MAKEDKNQDQPRSALRDALNQQADGANDPPQSLHVTPQEIGEITPPEEDSALSRPVSLFGPNNLDRAIFCRQFATMIEVGIPVLKALQMLSVRTSNGRLRRAVAEAAQSVEAGQPIHASMKQNERTFSRLVCSIVQIGESGGILVDSLVRLAEIMETKAKIRRQIMAAMAYPAAVICVAILMISLILIKAVPVFSQVYLDSGAELPGPTQFIIVASNFLQATWPLLLALLVGGVIALKFWSYKPSGRRFFSILALRLPVFRMVNRKISVARATRTLSGLITAGIPLVEALGITADSSENVLVGDALRQVQGRVETGGHMADTLAQAAIFPPVVIDMIAIGEETGTLDRMLNKVAEIYDGETESALNGLTAIIEPFLIVLLGGVVIFIALAALLPYFNLVDTV